jgi:hypothetical protein
LGGTTDVESDAHQSCMVYHIVTQAEDDANQVTWTLTNFYDVAETGRISATVLRGVDQTTPLGFANSGFNSANTATPWVIPDINPVYNNSVVLAGVVGDSTPTQTTPAGWTNRASGSSTQSNYLYSRNALTVAAELTGTTNVTPSTGDEYTAIAAEFKEATVPGNVFNLKGVMGPGDADITLSWLGPSSDGGSPLTDFKIEYTKDGGAWTEYPGVSTQQTDVVVTLESDATYQIRVSAVNSIGAGATTLLSNPVEEWAPNAQRLSSDEQNFTGTAGGWSGGTVSSGTYTKTEPVAGTLITLASPYVSVLPGGNACSEITLESFSSTSSPNVKIVSYTSAFVQIGVTGSIVGVTPSYQLRNLFNLPSNAAYVRMLIETTTSAPNGQVTISKAGIRAAPPPATTLDNIVVGMNACIV